MSSKPTAELLVLRSKSNRIKHLPDVNKVLIISSRNVKHLVDMPGSIMAAVETLKEIELKDRTSRPTIAARPKVQASQMQLL